MSSLKPNDNVLVKQLRELQMKNNDFPKIPLGDLCYTTNKLIIEPEEGWEEDSYYIVRVAYNMNNPVHEAILYTGFFDENKQPGEYHRIFNGYYGSETYELKHVHYLYPIRLICKLW